MPDLHEHQDENMYDNGSHTYYGSSPCDYTLPGGRKPLSGDDEFEVIKLNTSDAEYKRRHGEEYDAS